MTGGRGRAFCLLHSLLLSSSPSHSSDGIDGSKGDIGDPGPAGIKGRRGFPGSKGQKGDKGECGFTGGPGVDGEDGRDGLDGRNGTDGIPGRMVNILHDVGAVCNIGPFSALQNRRSKIGNSIVLLQVIKFLVSMLYLPSPQ